MTLVTNGVTADPLCLGNKEDEEDEEEEKEEEEEEGVEGVEGEGLHFVTGGKWTWLTGLDGRVECSGLDELPEWSW